MPDRKYYDAYQRIFRGSMAKNPAAVELGRRGGQARAESLTDKQREAIARMGGQARQAGRNFGDPMQQLQDKEEREGVVTGRVGLVRRLDEAVTTLFEWLLRTKRRALIYHQGDVWTDDPESHEFLVFSQRFPHAVVGVYELGVTRASVIEDLRIAVREAASA